MELHDAFGPDDVPTTKIIYARCPSCDGTGRECSAERAWRCTSCTGFGSVVIMELEPEERAA